MQILAMLNNKDELEEIKKYASGIILTNRFSSYFDYSFTDSELEEIINQDKNLEYYVLVNKLLFEEDLDSVKEFIFKFKDTGLNYIFADLAIYEILKELKIEDKGVYNPNTLICNYVDLLFWENKNIKGLFPSLEIPLEDVNTICKNKKNKIYYQAFGYSQMFQTKRKILSAYKDYKNLDFNPHQDGLYLIEEIRDEKYKVMENDNNAIIFQSGIHNILEALDIIVDDCDYLVIDHRFIGKDKYLSCLKIYNEALCDLDHLNYYNEVLNSLFGNLTTDFMYKDSIFRKEDF